ncbi:MAG: cation:proton antiporter [Chitinophagaceae bacterium]|nr:cation:proton antiporter [Chitinophagaceae bacterium]
MKKKQGLLFYFTTIVIFGGAMYWIVQKGNLLQKERLGSLNNETGNLSQPVDYFRLFTDSFHANLNQPLAILLLQIIVIVASARMMGYVFRKIGQPAVIGEIIAGIVLGPSILGLVLPSVNHFIFPVASLVNIQFLSQIGLILFMYVIGMELEVSAIRKQAFGAIIVSHTSIIFPFALGMGLAYFLYDQFAPANISFLAFSLFMGVAMSITAFPVLARILQEKDLTKTSLGTMAITSAAIGDLTAWFLLAAVIAIVKAGSSISILYSLGLTLLYVSVMFLVVKPLLHKLGTIYAHHEIKRKTVIAVIFMLLLLSSYATEVIGIHALFGAFLVGVIMPSSLNFRKIVTDKIEDVSIVLLLPLFFVFNGLRTQIGLLNEPHLWVICGWVVLVAVVGKFGGSAISARIVGQSWKDSLSIGVLMNTRGLMELIILNIGYDLGILSPEIFTMMVLMAIITTFMTGPALDLINWLMKENPVSGTNP